MRPLRTLSRVQLRINFSVSRTILSIETSRLFGLVLGIYDSTTLVGHSLVAKRCKGFQRHKEAAKNYLRFHPPNYGCRHKHMNKAGNQSIWGAHEHYRKQMGNPARD